MRETHFEDGKWWVSPYNFVPEVRNSLELPPKVEIHDATLRDGEQTPGVVFSVDDKIAIAQMLNDVGVDRIEAGMPAVSPQDAEAIKQISKLGLKSRIFTFARAMKQDIDMALECGAQGVIIGATNRSVPGFNNTLCFSPALIATADDIDEITQAVDKALTKVFG